MAPKGDNQTVDHHEGNGWSEYQKLVLKELDRLSDEIKYLKEEQMNTRLEVQSLKIKAGLWGGFSGVLAAIGIMLMSLLKK